ncbi:MAG TPA: S8 family serine peptidase [Chitinophagaceae bacterium]|jgi:hypothetical protein|nr:S8 family serine peptidase [Chitinophagaceae bacterium]
MNPSATTPAPAGAIPSATPRSSRGFSLHIGVNKADPKHYPGMPELKAAVNDALYWESFAGESGYETASLHDAEATADAVKARIREAAKGMQPGDIFLLTYAGHGGQLPNDKPAGFDKERMDQTWCLYDRQLLDDELFECFEAFREGTRIVVVSDSCHSGTVTRVADLVFSELLGKGMARAAGVRGYRSRKLPKEIEDQIIIQSMEEVYAPIQKAYKTKRQGSGVKAAVKLLAACQDDEETLDGERNGIFTEAFIGLFQQEAYRGATAEALIDAVSNRYFFPKPNFFQYGAIIESFDQSFPFDIQIPDAGKVTGNRRPELQQGRPARASCPEPAVLEETPEEQRTAVLVVEVEGGLGGNWTPGKGVTVLEQKQQPGREILTLELAEVPHAQSWSAAHALQTELTAQGYQAEVEPVLTVMPAQRNRPTREGDANNPDYMREWPPSLEQGSVGIGWHLDDAHAQLAKASAHVLAQNPDAHVRVGHFDTGYIEDHVALPQKLNRSLARSFISGEDPNQAIDKTESGQDGHGLGTMALLAGNKVERSHTFDEYEGFVGGVPFAEVVPVRLSESVVIMNAENFAEAIDYAIGQGCEVITMSMAGKPSGRMARAVNRAYEAGIVLVSAASNCWYKGAGALLPKCVMYPAAFERVIAATGAMYNHKPYDVQFLQQQRFNIGTKYMQGSWGPASRMTRALAAYTPNTPWASTRHTFLRSGGGTSSATPQVAAAAALWIAHHRAELEARGYYQPGNGWKKVEAVRHALFSTAAREEVFPDWKKYYGNGILRAFDALQVGVADESELEKAPEAESSFGGVFQLVGSFFKNRKLFRSTGVKPPEAALALELMHLMQTDPQFFDLFQELDLSNGAEVEAKVNTPDFRQKVQQSPYASAYLKEAMLD